MMASDGYHDELNGWLVTHYDVERAARDCNAPVMVSTTSVTSLQGASEDNTVMKYIKVWFIEAGYSDSRMTTLGDSTAQDIIEDDDLIVDYVLDHWAGEGDEVLSIAVATEYKNDDRTIYNAKGIS